MDGDHIAYKYELCWCYYMEGETKQYFIAGPGGENTFIGGSEPYALDPACLFSWTTMISADSLMNWGLVLTLEVSIIPYRVCTYVKIHSQSHIESMLTVSLYLNKFNKAKSSEDPLIYPMTSRETPSSSAPDIFVNNICRLYNTKLFYNSSPWQ